MSPLLLKTLLSLAVILAALALSAMLRRVARRLGQQRDFARARIFQMSVVINVLCLVVALLLLGAVWGLSGDGVMVFATSLLALLGVALFALAACAERIRNHGYVPSDDDLSQITVGVDTRDTVEEVLGAPSTSGVADASGFYYVRSQFRHFAYLEPKEINRELVAVTFDGDGVVQNIERYGLEDGQTVVLSRRVTTNEGDGDGILQQLLRSLGNFVPSTL